MTSKGPGVRLKQSTRSKARRKRKSSGERSVSVEMLPCEKANACVWAKRDGVADGIHKKESRPFDGPAREKPGGRGA